MGKFILAAAAALMVSALLGTAQAQEETVTATLVVVGYGVEVGNEVEVVALTVKPEGVDVVIEYDHHLAPVDGSCDRTGGLSERGQSGLGIVLVACSAGEALIRLLVADTAAIVAEHVLAIVDPDPSSRPHVRIFYDDRQLLRPREAVEVRFKFDEPVGGLDASGITVTNGAVGDLLEEDGRNFKYEVWPTAIANVAVSVNEGAATSTRAGLPNWESSVRDLGLPYDDDHDTAINGKEVLTAVGDYFRGLIFGNEVLSIVHLYFSGPIPREDQCPWFNDDDPHDDDGYAPIQHVTRQLRSDITDAIEAQLSKPEYASYYLIDEDTDLRVTLTGDILGSNREAVTPVGRYTATYRYGLLLVSFEFDNGNKNGSAKAYIEENPGLRRCTATNVIFVPPSQSQTG